MVKEFCPNFNFCQKWVWSCHAPQGDQNFLGLFSIFLDNKLHDTKELKIENIPFRTRPEFRFRSGTGSGGIWAGTGYGPVPIDLAGTRPVPNFFMLDYRFSIFCTNESPASPAPSSYMAGSRAPSTLQFPDCITCTPPLSSSQNLSRTAISPLATLGEVNYLYFHRLLLLLISHQAPTFPNNYTTKLICHKFYTLT